MAKTEKQKNKGGRPIIEIDKKKFETLCAIQCTEAEICAVLDITDKTLTKWCKRTYGLSFSEAFSVKREGGKASLRRRQFSMSETNPTMAIWLGKQYLGQSDKNDIKTSGELTLTWSEVKTYEDKPKTKKTKK